MMPAGPCGPGATTRHFVCGSGQLLERGLGVRFELPGAAGPVAAFAIRFDGVAHAYLNRCAHVAIELDWTEGRFFDEGGLYLTCATHGASYDPASGRCAGGPCAGRGLHVLECIEEGGQVWVLQRSAAPANDAPG